ncbi:GumK N-terminal domain-containing glycosyltransferase [Vibrio ulleungensis]|uniref:Glycosyltransferase n=1 Tax=Vibrio ulleungensis TaxID=2807619 RepID=A0ABS2HK89_9VIBR|nr:hypothetical protein [Vibrio ulleungensis]MBM7036282.1 hypothetical protein [Vibrio ulleungensis]
MNILFLSHTFIGNKYVVGSHHLAKQLAKQGHKVMHIPHPWSQLHQFKRGPREAFLSGEIEPNLWQFQVGGWLPSKWHTMGFSYASHSRTLAKAISQLAEENNIPHFDVCFVDDPVFQKAIQHLDCRKVIYRPTDIYTEMPKGAAYKQVEQKLIEQADHVVATSEAIVKFHQLNDQQASVLNNGFDFNHFANFTLNESDSDSSSIVKVGYVGSLDARFDTQLINSAAKALPDVEFCIHSPDLQHTLDITLPNLKHKGAVDYEVLPTILSHYDALIMPFTFTTNNKGRSPMKFFEYAATNKPMIVPDYFDDAGMPGVLCYQSPAQFIERIANLTPNTRVERDKAQLKRHCWSTKATQLLELSNALS